MVFRDFKDIFRVFKVVSLGLIFVAVSEHCQVVTVGDM